MSVCKGLFYIFLLNSKTHVAEKMNLVQHDWWRGFRDETQLRKQFKIFSDGDFAAALRQAQVFFRFNAQIICLSYPAEFGILGEQQYKNQSSVCCKEDCWIRILIRNMDPDPGMYLNFK